VAGHRIFATSFASIYPHYVRQAERKNRSKDEVDQVICWLTGYDTAGLETALADGSTSRPSSPTRRRSIRTPARSRA
jgi:hypothetical protein